MVYSSLMKRLTWEQCLKIVYIYYQKNNSVQPLLRALRPIFSQHNRLAESVIRQPWIGSAPRLLYWKNFALEQNIEETPDEYIRNTGQQLELCPSSLWKILRLCGLTA